MLDLMAGVTEIVPNGKANAPALREEGIDLPPADRWEVGAVWERSTEMFMPGGNGAPAQRMRLTQRSRVVRREKTSVRAGTWDALVVETTSATESEQGGEKKTTMRVAMTRWFVRDVGVSTGGKYDVLRDGEW